MPRNKLDIDSVRIAQVDIGQKRATLDIHPKNLVVRLKPELFGLFDSSFNIVDIGRDVCEPEIAGPPSYFPTIFCFEVLEKLDLVTSGRPEVSHFNSRALNTCEGFNCVFVVNHFVTKELIAQQIAEHLMVRSISETVNAV